MENENENAQRVNNFTASKAFGAGEMARLRRLRTESTALGAVEALQGKEFVDEAREFYAEKKGHVERKEKDEKEEKEEKWWGRWWGRVKEKVKGWMR